MYHSWDKFKEIIPKSYECSICGAVIKCISPPKKCLCGKRKFIII
jgi:rubrerythrin